MEYKVTFHGTFYTEAKNAEEAFKQFWEESSKTHLSDIEPLVVDDAIKVEHIPDIFED